MDNETNQAQSASVQNLQPEAEKITILPEAGKDNMKKSEAVKNFFKHNWKPVIIIAVIIVVGIGAYFFRGLVIAATVDGNPISRLSVIQKLEKASGKTLLDSLITEKLVQNAADAQKITISNDEINAEIKGVEDQVVAQGGTLAAALAAQGMSMDDLKTEVILRKEMEKLLGDKISVTDQEIAQYIKDNKVSVPKGQEAATDSQIKSQLSSQKFSTEAQTLIAELKSKAKIKYFVNY